jgi:hypothetical protein
MIQERIRAGLTRVRDEENASGGPQLPPHSKNESVRPWRLLGGPVCASSNGFTEMKRRRHPLGLQISDKLLALSDEVIE